MMLEEYEQYTAVNNTKINLDDAIKFDDMVYSYGFELLKILGKTGIPRDQREEELKEEKVIVGLIDDLMMPSGYRHKQSGKCLGGNGPSLTGEKRVKYLSGFDISIK